MINKKTRKKDILRHLSRILCSVSIVFATVIALNELNGQIEDQNAFPVEDDAQIQAEGEEIGPTEPFRLAGDDHDRRGMRHCSSGHACFFCAPPFRIPI